MENSDKTLVHFLGENARQLGEKPAFRFLDGKSEDTLSFAELESKARQIARGIAQKVAPGERVVLLFPPGLDYVKAFFGCLYAGVIAVPLYPPRAKQRTDRIRNVLSDCDARMVISSGTALSALEKYQDVFAADNNMCLETAVALEQTHSKNDRELPSAQDIAFIQYTSGSTGSPKGVVISQRNIVANLQALTERTGCAGDDVFVNWLPLFHDLGLVNTVLLPVYLGASSVLMPAVNFMQDPLIWFKAIAKYKGNICGAPNFAYQHCVQKIKLADVQGLDLSSWRIAFNAAEPINDDILQEFSDKFANCGFAHNAHYPAYGMAEATVFLSGVSGGSPPVVTKFDKAELKQGRLIVNAASGQPIVSCGLAASGHRIVIVDPNTQKPVPEGRIGEVWVAGPSIAVGYWNQAQLTSQVFTARLAGIDDDTCFLRTGDLGFLHNDALYINGRLKDVVVIRGLNYYPQDIEYAVVSCSELLKSSSAVAFDGANHAADKLVVVVEVKPSRIKQVGADVLIAEIQKALAIELELKAEIVLVRMGRVSKTSSGKVQRSLMKAKYLNLELEGIVATSESNSHQVSEAGKTSDSPMTLKGDSQEFADIWFDVLKVRPQHSDADFFAQGADSLDVIKLASKIEAQFNIRMSLETLYELSTFSRMLETIKSHRSEGQLVCSAEFSSDSKHLSFPQQRLWFLTQEPEQNKTLNIFNGFAIKGQLDITQLQRAFSQLCAKHEILRTRYFLQNGVPVQEVLPGVEADIQFTDLQALAHKTSYIEDLCRDNCNVRFDLENGPIFKVDLLRLSENHFHLYFTIHHIATDAWSMSILMKDLQCFYQRDSAASNDENSAEQRFQYQDYVYWSQKQYVENQKTQSLQYWEKQLAGAPQVLQMPTDNPSLNQRSFAGKLISRELPQKAIDAILTEGKKNKFTLFSALLSVFQLQISRITGENDILIGTDIANRENERFSEVVGFFVDQMVLRGKIDDYGSFAELVSHNNKTVIQGLDNPIPFDKLVESLRIERNPLHTPLFQIKFLLNSILPDVLQLQDLNVTPLAIATEYAQYDLTLSVDLNTQNNALANFVYRTDLLTSEQVETLADDYVNILGYVAEHLDSTLSSVPNHLTQSASFQAWMQGPVSDEGSRLSIPKSLAARATQKPDAIALVQQGQTMTYRVLEAEANKLANFLFDIGIESGSIVGVHIPRSFNQIITLLALQKLNAGFLPLDTDYPKERIAFMLEDSMVDMVITSDAQSANLSCFDGGVIELDEARSITADESSEFSNPLSYLPESVAYQLYTSGSSGKPKGAVITNRSLLNLCRWYLDFAEIDEASVVLQPIPLGFDASIKNIFCPLMAGAKLVLPDNNPFDPVNYLDLINTNKVTLLNCVPSLFYPIVALAEKQQFMPLRSLKMLAVGGEAPELQTFKTWLQHNHCQCTLANIYGPTECTDISAAYKLKAADIDQMTSVPIGKPIRNAKIFVVNDAYELVPPGVEGQLLIAGEGVANGYAGQAKVGESAANFSTFQGQKVYKTGDLAKWTQAGQLVYMGRIDDQIKINGIRIETGEIERAIQSIPGIKRVCVLKVAEKIAAFLIADGLTPPGTAQIRDALSHMIPRNWTPHFFVYQPQFPMLPNGKIDKVTLANMPLEEKGEGCDRVAPDSELETLMFNIWCDVLEVDKFGVTDNFFALGGDSMAAVKVAAKGQESGISLTVSDLFERQTIRLLMASATLITPIQTSDDRVLDEGQTVSCDALDSFDMLSDDDLQALEDLEQTQDFYR